MLLTRDHGLVTGNVRPPTLDPGLRIYALNSGLGTMDSQPGTFAPRL